MNSTIMDDVVKKLQSPRGGTGHSALSTRTVISGGFMKRVDARPGGMRRSIAKLDRWITIDQSIDKAATILLNTQKMKLHSSPGRVQ